MHLQFSLRDNIEYNLYPHEHPIPVEIEYKDLGVIATTDLTWKAHYGYLASSAYKTLGLLQHTFHSVPSIHATKLLSVTLIHTQLLYFSQVWRPHFIKDIKLERFRREP